MKNLKGRLSVATNIKRNKDVSLDVEALLPDFPAGGFDLNAGASIGRTEINGEASLRKKSTREFCPFGKLYGELKLFSRREDWGPNSSLPIECSPMGAEIALEGSPTCAQPSNKLRVAFSVLSRTFRPSKGDSDKQLKPEEIDDSLTRNNELKASVTISNHGNKKLSALSEIAHFPQRGESYLKFLLSSVQQKTWRISDKFDITPITRFAGGIIFPFGNKSLSKIPVVDRFFPGGPEGHPSLLGFKSRMTGSREIGFTSCCVGEDNFLSQEFRLKVSPLGKPSFAGFGAIQFAALGCRTLPFGKSLRGSAGLGISMAVSEGATFDISFAVPIHRQNGDTTQILQFALDMNG